MAPTRSNGGNAKPDAAASAPRADVASAPPKKPGADGTATVAAEGERRRKSSEELEKQFAEQAAEPTFKPVSKGKVSDATFGMAEERLRLRYRSQDDCGTMAQQLGMMQSSPAHRLGYEDSKTARSGTRGGESPPPNGSGRRGRSRAELALARHTLDTAPGAQGVVRHTEWVTANAGRRGHRNVIESQPERIAFQGGGKAAIAPPPEERRLDRLEAKFLKETLTKHWLFENFSDSQFSILTKNCETVDLKEGQPLILQGAEDDGRMYILHRGTLSVHVLDSKKKDGEKKDGADNGADRASDPPGAQQPQAAGVADRGMHVATVLSGGWVGDMALLYKTTRTATVIAEVDSRVLAVPRLAYENVIAEGYEAVAVDTSSTNEFASVPVLCNLKDSNVLTQQARGVTWAAGDVLIESGMGARELLIITNGEVEFRSRALDSGSLQQGGEYRWSLQQAFISGDKLTKGDVMAAGRPGDEALLVTLHNQGLARAAAKNSTAKLKLAGGLAPGTANAVALSDGKGYRVYLQDVVTHTALLEPLSDSLEGIRSLLQCTPALAKQLNTAAFDAASFVMHPVKYNVGATIPMAKSDSKSAGNPLMVLVSGKVGVRRSDDVSIRGDHDPPPKDSSDGKKDDGIVARLYDVMTTIIPEDAPSHKLVAKTNCTLLAMNRTDHADLMTRHEPLSAVRKYPPKRPLSVAAAEFGVRASTDGNVMRIEDLSFERKIGQGAYGAVYLVVHRPTGRTLAAKIIKLARLRKHQKDDAINVERHVMQDSVNPFIVRLYATHKTKTHLLLVMEAGLGGELFSFLLRQEHQVLREDSVRFYGACVLSALHAMHDDGYMYRDLKPENVVITADGYCKIVDFGFAKRTAARTYTVCGTNAYLSPEMLTVQGHNFEVDYWAFGVFLYEMAIGCASFNVEPDGTMNHEMPPFKVCQNILNPNYRLRFDIGVYRVSPELQDVITQLLERRVEHRIGCRVRGAQELYEHPFFAPIDFEKLAQFQYQPPWNPELQNALDTRYFESTHKMRKSELVAFGITTDF